MKPRLQASLGQQLVLTPQLRQALRLLQLSAVELEAELATAVESNPLLDWAEGAEDAAGAEPVAEGASEPGVEAAADAEDWREPVDDPERPLGRSNDSLEADYVGERPDLGRVGGEVAYRYSETTVVVTTDGDEDR